MEKSETAQFALTGDKVAVAVLEQSVQLVTEVYIFPVDGHMFAQKSDKYIFK